MNEPMSDKVLDEIRQAQDETKAEMDAWYAAHPNPRWRNQHPFDHDSIVTNTHVYLTVPALIAEVDRLRAEAILLKAQAEGAGSLLLGVQQDCIAATQQVNAMRPIVEEVAKADRHGQYDWMLAFESNDLIERAQAALVAHQIESEATQ